MLSGQGRQVVRLRRAGYSNKEIGKVVGLSKSDVDRVIREAAKHPVKFKRERIYWTDERNKQLKELAEAGKSPAQLRAAFGGRTPNAIRAQLRKLGIQPKDAVWNEERNDLLKTLRADGLLYSQIAIALNERTNPERPFTRNAISGQVDRLGLAKRNVEVRNIAGKSTKTKNKNKKAVLRATLRSFDGPLQGAGRLVAPATLPAKECFPLPQDHPEDVATVASVADLEPHHCKWPVGDPKADFKGFCGCKRKTGSPYCEHHAQRASQGPETRLSSFDRKAFKHLQPAE